MWACQLPTAIPWNLSATWSFLALSSGANSFELLLHVAVKRRDAGTHVACIVLRQHAVAHGIVDSSFCAAVCGFSRCDTKGVRASAPGFVGYHAASAWLGQAKLDCYGEAFLAVLAEHPLDA